MKQAKAQELPMRMRATLIAVSIVAQLSSLATVKA